MEKGDRRNFLSGIAYEKSIVDKLNEIPSSPEVGRTAEIRPSLDAQKVDIVTIDPLEFEEFALRIQAKTSTKHVAYTKLLKEIENQEHGGIPVILHRKTKKAEEGRYLTEGMYAILSQEDFFDIIGELMKYKKGFQEFNQRFDFIADDEQKLLHARLLELGL